MATTTKNTHDRKPPRRTDWEQWFSLNSIPIIWIGSLITLALALVLWFCSQAE